MGLIAEIKQQPDLQRLARVKEGTHIDMVEFDLYQFRRDNPSDWDGMFRIWLEKGASIDLFYQQMI